LIFLFFIINILFGNNSDPTGKLDNVNYFINNNPASINKNIIIGMSPNRFGVSELDEIYLAGYYNKNNYSLYGGINSINNELNRELNINFGGVYKYNNIFDVGVRFNYLNNNIKDYININKSFLDIGAILYFDSLSIGGYFNNIYSTNNDINNFLYFKTAASYNYNLFAFYFGPEIILNKSYGLTTGIKYNFNNYINFRINYSSLFNTFNSSISILLNNYIINVSISKHNNLGYSQDYQILYDF